MQEIRRIESSNSGSNFDVLEIPVQKTQIMVNILLVILGFLGGSFYAYRDIAELNITVGIMDEKVVHIVDLMDERKQSRDSQLNVIGRRVERIEQAVLK